MAYGRRYSVVINNTAIPSAKTIIGITGTAAIRPKIYELNFGSPATPADNAADANVKRSTVVGTTTAFTPTALDPADSMASVTAGYVNASVDPTYTASSQMLAFGWNQRAAYRWLANPDSEIVCAVGAGLGLGVQNQVVNAAFNVTGCLFFSE